MTAARWRGILVVLFLIGIVISIGDVVRPLSPQFITQLNQVAGAVDTWTVLDMDGLRVIKGDVCAGDTLRLHDESWALRLSRGAPRRACDARYRPSDGRGCRHTGCPAGRIQVLVVAERASRDRDHRARAPAAAWYDTRCGPAHQRTVRPPIRDRRSCGRVDRNAMARALRGPGRSAGASWPVVPGRDGRRVLASEPLHARKRSRRGNPRTLLCSLYRRTSLYQSATGFMPPHPFEIAGTPLAPILILTGHRPLRSRCGQGIGCRTAPPHHSRCRGLHRGHDRFLCTVRWSPDL